MSLHPLGAVRGMADQSKSDVPKRSQTSVTGQAAPCTGSLQDRDNGSPPEQSGLCIARRHPKNPDKARGHSPEQNTALGAWRQMDGATGGGDASWQTALRELAEKPV